MVIESWYIQALAFCSILLSFGIWRWSPPIAFSCALVWFSYQGHWLTFPYAIICAGEIVSAWIGEPWTMVVWQLVRPNSIDRMSPAWKAAFERARKRDTRRIAK